MRILGGLALAALVCAAPAAAQSVAARQFGARESVRQMSLSPDGARYAVIASLPSGRGEGLLVGKLDESGELNPILRASGDPERLRFCRWSTSTRLVCGIQIYEGDGEQLRARTRMVAIDADGSNLQELSAQQSYAALAEPGFGGEVIDWLPEGSGSAVLMARDFVPERTEGVLTKTTRTGLGVERVDTVTLERTTIERARNNASDYVTDGHGTVRAMVLEPAAGTGYMGSRIGSLYRRKGAEDWLDLATATADSQTVRGFVPLAVDRDLDVAYGFDDHQGRKSLFSIALDGSLRRELVFAHPRHDLAGLVRIGRAQRVVGVSYVTDKRETAFFDPGLKALAASIGKALPGLPLVSFVDASSDENKLMLFAGSDVDPGHYFVLDRAARKMDKILPIRPELANVALAPVKPIEFAAADGARIPGYLTLPSGSDGRNLPAIVMPHGGPTSRDEWGFDWLAQFFAHRGFAVLQPNFRGSSGYGADWFEDNGFRSWKVAIGDVNDGARWLVREGVAAPGKLAILGWSYGGYAALQSSVLDPDLFKAIVAIAPVTDLDQYKDDNRLFTIFSRIAAFVGEGPHVLEGSPAQNAARIKAPVLLFHGTRDLNVRVGQSQLMAARLRAAGGRVELVEFPKLAHSLDDGPARIDLLDRSDRFIRAALGLAAAP